MVRTKIAAAAAALVLSTTVFASGVSSARAADLASFAGVYVGHSKVLQGSCTSGTRLISIVIKSTGEARMLFSMKDGTELKGMVDGNGKVTMKTLAGNLILSFEVPLTRYYLALILYKSYQTVCATLSHNVSW